MENGRMKCLQARPTPGPPEACKGLRGLQGILTGVYVHSQKAPPIVLPSRGVKADGFLRCLTTLLMDGNGLSRPGGNLGLRI